MVNAPVLTWNTNPTIANVFYRRGMMEAWGRGIGLIMESCREQELLVPETKVVPPFVNLTIWFKRSLTLGVKTSTPQDKVFEFCKSPKSIVEIAAMLGVNDRRWVRKVCHYQRMI